MEKVIKVKCETCDGTGQKTGWSDKFDMKGKQKWLVEDCPDCDGVGKTDIMVIDNREKTKRWRGMVFPRSA